MCAAIFEKTLGARHPSDPQPALRGQVWGSLKWGEFCNLPITKSLGKYPNAVHSETTDGIVLSIFFFCPLSMTLTQFGPVWHPLRRDIYDVTCFRLYSMVEMRKLAHGSNVFVSSKRIDWYAKWPSLIPPDLRSSINLDLSMAPCICFDVSQRQEHGGMRALLVQVLCENKSFYKSSYFDLSRPLAL